METSGGGDLRGLLSSLEWYALDGDISEEDDSCILKVLNSKQFEGWKAGSIRVELQCLWAAEF